MNERIEMIKNLHNNDEEVHKFDIDWLIEQAEKVEELERRLNAVTSSTQKEIAMLHDAVEEDDITKTRYATTMAELISLNLWSARRLTNSYHKEFAHDELEKITGLKHERL